MTVYKRVDRRADGSDRERWQIRFSFPHPDGRTQRIRRTLPEGTRKRDAEATETRIRAALSAGTYNTHVEEPKPAPLLSDFREKWLTTYAAANLKPSTIKGYRSDFKQIEPHFLDLRIDQITVAGIDSYIAECRKIGHSAKTIQNRLGVLYKLLGTAVEYGELDASKLPQKRKIKVPNPKIEFLTDEELDAILAAAESDPLMHRLLLLAAHTGLRRGEIFGLQWDAVRLDVPEIEVRRSYERGVVSTPKSVRYRLVPLNSASSRMLRELRPANAKSGVVFVDEQGNRWTPERLKNRLAKIGNAAGRDRLGWHIFRHTFATRLVRKGVPLNVVQQLLGHSDIRMTMRYAHVIQTDKADAVAMLDG